MARTTATSLNRCRLLTTGGADPANRDDTRQTTGNVFPFQKTITAATEVTRIVDYRERHKCPLRYATTNAES
jgi:hypothetical protein